MARRFNDQEKYIERCKNFHSDKYDYTKTKYISWKTNVTITCKIHGDFIIRAIDHYIRGCQKCGWEKLGNSKRKIKPIKINKIKKTYNLCTLHGKYITFCKKCEKQKKFIE